MGCNKSAPEEVLKPPTNNQKFVFHKPKRSGNSRFINKEMGSIVEHYKILKALGTTNTGTLLYAQELHSGTFRTIREVNKSLAKESADILTEISILSDIDHPNIIKIYQTIETAINYYIVFEHLDGGNLLLNIKKYGNELLLSKHCHDILSGLNYIHKRGIVHCDISLTNILFTKDNFDPIPKIVGFSYSQRLSNVSAIDLKNLSYIYASPEMLKKNFNEKTDL